MSNSENKVEIVPVGNVLRAIVFMGLGIVSVIIGLILTPSAAQIAEGFRLQQSATGLLDLNTFAVVGAERIGVPFINAGILVIVVMLSYLITGTTINGGSIAAAFMVFGFGFCGKTLWNVWPLFFGVLLHAKINKKAINTVTGLGWFSAALSPLVSTLTFYIVSDGSSNETIGEAARFNVPGFVIAIVLGLVAGYLVAVFAGFLPDKHTGLTLYNAGFAAGLAGFLIFSVMKVIGLGHTGPGPYHDFPDINNPALAVCIAVLLIYLMLCGLLIAVTERGKIDVIVAKKYAGSAVEQFGFGATLVNMSVCGFFCLLYWALTTTANAHGPLFACLFTVTGFASNGISVRTMAPIFAGVYATSFGLTAVKALLTGAPVLESAFAYVGSKNMLIAAIFGCGMAPVVYRHGALVGFFAGVIHSVLVPNTGGLHGWMNLYNNGFCLGLVVTFFVPMLVILLNKNKKEDTN
ncbi:MAG: DUF1576 domain-containing protein [Lachnospiraceae bacterium]|nr:DUF1576 domain-containing protein [Lachnospiraceae bacterium]